MRNTDLLHHTVPLFDFSFLLLAATVWLRWKPLPLSVQVLLPWWVKSVLRVLFINSRIKNTELQWSGRDWLIVLQIAGKW